MTYYVTTYDWQTGEYTPQVGLSPGPYRLGELRGVLKQLRDIGYDVTRDGGHSVLVQREDHYTKETDPCSRDS